MERTEVLSSQLVRLVAALSLGRSSTGVDGHGAFLEPPDEKPDVASSSLIELKAHHRSGYA